jgi:hypothetical protein
MLSSIFLKKVIFVENGCISIWFYGVRGVNYGDARHRFSAAGDWRYFKKKYSVLSE